MPRSRWTRPYQQKLVDLIGEVSTVFWQTEESKAAGVYPPAWTSHFSN